MGEFISEPVKCIDFTGFFCFYLPGFCWIFNRYWKLVLIIAYLFEGPAARNWGTKILNEIICTSQFLMHGEVQTRASRVCFPLGKSPLGYSYCLLYLVSRDLEHVIRALAPPKFVLWLQPTHIPPCLWMQLRNWFQSVSLPLPTRWRVLFPQMLVGITLQKPAGEYLFLYFVGKKKNHAVI